jgi:thymidylate synthase (FAD)
VDARCGGLSEAQFRSDFWVEVIDHMGDDISAVRAARVSTLGAASVDSGESQGLINFLVREGHHTPFEHQVVTFRLAIPIFVSRQLVKHRITSINEESGRYKELEGVFYVPSEERAVKQVGKTGDYEFVPDDTLNSVANVEFRYACSVAWETYRRMRDDGIAKEVARMVLPVNTYSTMYLTLNSRSMFNFLKQRSSYGVGHPQDEIRQVVDLMYTEWAGLYPQTAQAWMTYWGGKND